MYDETVSTHWPICRSANRLNVSQIRARLVDPAAYRLSSLGRRNVALGDPASQQHASSMSVACSSIGCVCVTVAARQSSTSDMLATELAKQKFHSRPPPARLSLHTSTNTALHQRYSLTESTQTAQTSAKD